MFDPWRPWRFDDSVEICLILIEICPHSQLMALPELTLNSSMISPIPRRCTACQGSWDRKFHRIERERERGKGRERNTFESVAQLLTSIVDSNRVLYYQIKTAIESIPMRIHGVRVLGTGFEQNNMFFEQNLEILSIYEILRQIESKTQQIALPLR